MTSTTKRVKIELEAIREKSRGVLHAAAVVQWARAHKTSALHGQFEWNDTKAAYKFRLWQARQIIQIFVVDDAGLPEMVSLSIDRVGGGGYRNIPDVLNSKRLSAIMLKDALSELERVQERYRLVRELTSVWNAVARVRKGKRRAK